VKQTELMLKLISIINHRDHTPYFKFKL